MDAAQRAEQDDVYRALGRFFIAFSSTWRVRLLRPVFARLPHAITIRAEALIIEFVAGERLVMRTSQGPFPMETTYEWTEVEQGRTLMRLRNRGEPSGFGRIAAPALAAAIRRNTTKDLARLKQLLER